jgi:hypothetical protein
MIQPPVARHDGALGGSCHRATALLRPPPSACTRSTDRPTRPHVDRDNVIRAG